MFPYYIVSLNTHFGIDANEILCFSDIKSTIIGLHEIWSWHVYMPRPDFILKTSLNPNNQESDLKSNVTIDFVQIIIAYFISHF